VSYGQAELYTLLTDSTITALLTDGEDGIWYDTVVPETTGSKDATINYYRVTPVSGGLDYTQTVYSVNCRAFSMEESEAIARAVFDVLNRHSQDSFHFVCEVLGTIPPADPTDNYNSPVEVLTRGRDL